MNPAQSSVVELFTQFQEHIDADQLLREEIKVITKELEKKAKQLATTLQIIHADLTAVGQACLQSRQLLDECRDLYAKLAATVPEGKYYRYCDQWHFLTQRIVQYVALTIYLEAGFLVTRETTAEILGLKVSQQEGFHLDVEDYLMGVLNTASELIRFATNSVTLGDFGRPLHVARFVADLSTGFRLLNLKNDGLRKRSDGLKYDVKKIEEVVYDLSIRGLNPSGGVRGVEAASSAGDSSSAPVATAD